MSEFFMPGEPEELWLPESELAFKAKHIVDFSDVSSADIGEVTEGVAFKLCDQDPLCIIEQTNFDVLCSVVRCFDALEAPRRRQLLDALCSSLTCLNAWVDRLLSGPAEGQDRDALADYRSAFKAYLFFLQWIAKSAAREAREASASMSISTAGSTKGRSRKKLTDDSVWDWASQFPKIMKTIGHALNTDLWALFRPNRPDQAVLINLIQLASTALEQPSSAKDQELAGAAAHVLAGAALKYQQLDAVSAALVDVINKYEHTPAVVAELLRYSVSQSDDGRLAAAVMAEVAAVDPTEYERQQNATGEKAGVRSVAAFLEEMSSRMPRFMVGQIALFLPHLGGKAWSLRCGIVSAIGHLLHKAFDGEAADAQGAVARLRSKQHLLDILCERIRDQSSFVRKAVLQTWAYLAEHRAVPLGHWQVVTTVATGRLEDKSSLVRKEALRLLGALMLHNPFGPALPLDRFAASLQVHREMLDQVMPPRSSKQSGEEFAATQEVLLEANQDGSGAEQQATCSEADGECRPTEEDKKMQEAAPMDMEGVDTTVENQDGQQEQQRNVQPQQAAPGGRTCAEVCWDGSVEELQALVASLELAVDFAKSLSGCMPTLVQLLASSTVSDVQESVAMLLTCKQFEVAGAPEAIRKMLPLIFARDQAVKDRIVEALDQLYISGWAGNTFTSAQAARNLVDLASGATLGELGSLEEVIKELMQRGFVTPVTLHELWELANRAGAALAAGASGASRARRDLRSALAVLSMAIAFRPEAVGEREVAALLRLGFPGGKPVDALAMRHACMALQRLGETAKAGLLDHVHDSMYAAFVRTVVASPLPEASWYSAVEAAVASIYALHPTPEHISAAIIRRLAEEAFRSPQGNADHDERECCDEAETGGALGEHDNARGQKSTCDGPLSVRALSRFFFVLGHVALQHLVLIERAAKEVRRARFNAEKRAAEGQAERATAAATSGGKQEGGKAKGKGKAGSKQSTTADSEDQTKEGEEDINAELGVGSVAADAELDAMKEAAEAQMFSAQSLLGPYVKIVSAVCHNRQVLSGDSALRSSALLALTKLMVVDGSMCDANLQLVFTLLHNRAVEPALRSNLVIALGDLTLRFPNAMEPWTEHIYRPLGDPDAGVRKNALMVLTHLILNDMMKVKGHIAKVAVCLEDSEPRIAALAQLFFHELAKKEYKGTSPIYNLLPDILSNLSRETSLTRAQFQSVMQQLLSYIKKDRQGDALVEKLCGRFAATQDASQWRNVAFCLTQLPLSDKGMRKLNECFKLYKTALADGEVADSIASILAKAKKNATKPDAKQLVEELEAKIAACAAERAEEEATAERAQQDLASRAGSGSAQSQGRHGGDGASDAEGHGGEGVAETAAEEDVEMGDAATDKGRAGGAPLVKPEQEESAIGPISDCNTTITIPMEQATRSPDAPAASRNRSRRSRQQSKDAEAVPVSQEEAATSKAPGVRRSSRRGTSGVSGSSQVPVVKEESEEHVTRARRSTRGKQSMPDAVDLGVKARKGRRNAGAVVDSDGGSEEEGGDEELKIAALQAGMAAIKIEQEM